MIYNQISLDDYKGAKLPLGDYDIIATYNDVILGKYIDLEEIDRQDMIKRGEIYVQASTIKQSWRVVEVILVGENVKSKTLKVGDTVILPSDKGIPMVKGGSDGHPENYVFFNEDRIFCKVVKKESKPAKKTKVPTKPS